MRCKSINNLLFQKKKSYFRSSLKASKEEKKRKGKYEIELTCEVPFCKREPNGLGDGFYWLIDWLNYWFVLKQKRKEENQTKESWLDDWLSDISFWNWSSALRKFS